MWLFERSVCVCFPGHFGLPPFFLLSSESVVSHALCSCWFLYSLICSRRFLGSCVENCYPPPPHLMWSVLYHVMCCRLGETEAILCCCSCRQSMFFGWPSVLLWPCSSV